MATKGDLVEISANIHPALEWRPEEWRQEMQTRRLYASENGDIWDLAKDGERLLVLHRPNVASGGKLSEIELDAFLSRERHTPQVVALVTMIGTLLDPEVV